MEKAAWDGPKWGQEFFFPTNPDLADILGRTDLDFENLYCLFGLQISGFSRSPDLQISEFPGPQISKFQDFQDPNLTPLPTHPGIKYVARALAAIWFAEKQLMQL